MELIHLRYFKKAAELESITKAANELRISQPSLTKMIKTLENELQYELFDRKGRNIILNDNGKIFLKHVNLIFDAMHNAVLELNDHNQKKQMTITISVMAAGKLLPDLIQGFKKKHPNINIDIITLDTDSVAESSCDLLLSSSLESEDCPGSTTLFKENLMLAVPKGHALASQPFVQLKTLKNEDFVASKPNSVYRKILMHYFDQAGFTPKIVLDSDYSSIIKSLVQSGIGIAIMPEYTWEEAADSHLAFLPIVDPPCFRYLKLYWNPYKYATQAVEKFKSYTIDFFKSLDLSEPSP